MQYRNPMMPQVSNPNPSSNPYPHNPGEEYKSLEEALDKIYSCLMEGQVWHERMANECRKIYIRGWARWHEAEAKGDVCYSMKLNKVIMDKLWYSPKLDVSKIDKASKAVLNGMTDFQAHHDEWKQRETKLSYCLNYTINEARTRDIELYEKLCCLQKEVQNEIMRVQFIIGRLGLKPNDGHDVGVISKWLHDYFECEYKQGEPIDFNVG